MSFWDALLWATADRIGVRHLLTEDFQDGRMLGGVTFVNPFNGANARLLAEILPAP
jgi:predicted nucleic acid-binding protein